MSDQPDRMDVEVQTSDAVSPVVSNTPSPIEQKRIVRELLDSANEDGVVEGRKYALVPTKWWRAWKTYSGYDSDSPKEDETPGVIDNSGLLESIDGDEVVKKVRTSGDRLGVYVSHLSFDYRHSLKCGIMKFYLKMFTFYCALGTFLFCLFAESC